VYPFALRAAATDTITLDVSRPAGGATTAQVPSVMLGTRLEVNGAGSTLTVSGPVTLQANVVVDHVAAVSFDGAVTGAFGLTKAGAGTLTFAGGGATANTYTGETVVNDGMLRLAKNGGATAVPGNLRVNGPGSVRLEQNHQIGDTAAVVVNAVTGPAALDLNGRTETIGSLDNGGTVTTGAGALSVGPVTGTGTINVSAAGGSLVANYLRQGTLTLAPGATAAVRPRSAGGATSVLRSLGIGGSTDAWTGKLDLADTAMILDHSGGNTSPIATVANQLKAGRAGGNWSGNGITSSSAAATPGTALGYAESSQVLGAGGGTFRGQPADGTALLLRYTLYGDTNLDGFVNGTDFAILAGNFGKTGQFWSAGDLDYDLAVTASDFALLAGNFGKIAPGGGGVSLSAGEWEALEAFGTSIGVPVPEPGAAALVVLAGAGLLSRRRRQTS
jgi:autotransporter-associated beta strand protein